MRLAWSRWSAIYELAGTDINITASQRSTVIRFESHVTPLRRTPAYYVVFNCASEPKVTAIQNPAGLEWEALAKIDCYSIGADRLLQANG